MSALIVTAVCAVATKIVAIVGGMATLGESLPDDAALAAARIGGLVAIVAGTVALSRFGGRETSSDSTVRPRHEVRRPTGSKG